MTGMHTFPDKKSSFSVSQQNSPEVSKKKAGRDLVEIDEDCS
jgi:hypothetical protein